ncbi:MAG: NAD-dependent epimerase/dehydratase family protein, partial [Gordonia polyisoprenivorans]|nr:NAD-dependent epimerase/dehydratase family protein [Gordonia polyisoprenivorans]
MRVVLSGGAGYIGSHTAVELARAGHSPVIVDDLSATSGVAVSRIRELSDVEVPFYEIDVTRPDAVMDTFTSLGKVNAIIHLAARKAIGESVEKPLEYYWNNVNSTLVMLDMMTRFN